MSLLLIVKRDWGIKDILKSFEAPTRKKGKVSGSHIDDIVANKEALILCDACVHKFNAKAVGYAKPRRFSTVRAKCDDCREFGFGTMFLDAATKFT